MTQLELDSNVDISNIHEETFTEVINAINCVSFIGTVISNKQLTALLTKILNNGTGIEKLALRNIKFPRVHPNILGPGLAQFPTIDISGIRD